ncbi:hypothetical protein SALBM311S_03492 [Streptomyces alboniger]
MRHDREAARQDLNYGDTDTKVPRSDHSLLIAQVDTDFRDKAVRGRELTPEGPRAAPLPAGLEKFPAKGEMVVSLKLKRLLESDSGRLLRERLPQRIVGTIGENGLVGSAELAFYRGGENLAEHLAGGGAARIDRFGEVNPTSEETDPVLVLLILVVFVVLLMPVAVFIAAAVRFGGERRDRRLAALRLVGSDGRGTRRIAAGEALAGAVLGLVFGAGFFMIGRQVAGSIEVFDVSVFPSYLDPSPALALLVGLTVPAAAVPGHAVRAARGGDRAARRGAYRETGAASAGGPAAAAPADAAGRAADGVAGPAGRLGLVGPVGPLSYGEGPSPS